MHRAVRLRAAVSMLCLVVLAMASEAAAESIGVFRWQLLPYCNVVTLSVTQENGMFSLTGFDDQCGAGQRAGVIGTAFQNPDGTVGMALSTVTAPGGLALHIDARISLATLGGPWHDTAGNAGTLALTSGSGAGSLRPVPPGGVAPGSITTASIAPGAIGAAQIDSSQVQARVIGTCAVGEYLRGINANGTVLCEPAANVVLTRHREATTLPAGNVPITVTALTGLQPGSYLFSAYTTAVDFGPAFTSVRCGIRAAGQDSFGNFGSATAVGGETTFFAQVTVALAVTSAVPFDAELYCLTAASEPTPYVEEAHLYGIRVAAAQFPTQN